MRESKFRAWDGNRLIYDGDIVAPQHLEGMRQYLSGAEVTHRGVLVWFYESRLPNATDLNFDHTTGIPTETIEQFTGLHDRNGVEIYEGDLVARRSVIYAVEFIEGEFSPVAHWEHREAVLHGATEAVCEVIGNIHETPELLDG